VRGRRAAPSVRFIGMGAAARRIWSVRPRFRTWETAREPFDVEDQPVSQLEDLVPPYVSYGSEAASRQPSFIADILRLAGGGVDWKAERQTAISELQPEVPGAVGRRPSADGASSQRLGLCLGWSWAEAVTESPSRRSSSERFGGGLVSWNRNTYCRPAECRA
jgi:hypothetical protein